MKKTIKKNIEKVLKGNGWVDEDEIANELHTPFLEVHEVLKQLERDDFVESK